MVLEVISILLAVIFIWLFCLSIFLYRNNSHYNRLTAATGKIDLTSILEKILQKDKENDLQMKTIVKDIKNIETNIKLHLQRVGIIRYNPFSDTGGTQSFTLAILDGLNNGIIITSLYARSGNRWYIKYVKNGQGVNIDLSKEEKMAILKAEYISETKG
jgi:hypothetical protein